MTSDRGAVFVYCPVLARYPPQPVRSCEAYRPDEDRATVREDER